MAGTGEIKYSGRTGTSAAACSLILACQGLEEENLDQKSPGPPGLGLMQQASPLLAEKEEIAKNCQIGAGRFRKVEQPAK